MENVDSLVLEHLRHIRSKVDQISDDVHAASVSHEDATIQEFKDNPQEAAAYLSAVLEDGDQEEVLLALRRITPAFGGVPKLAEQTDLYAKTLYRTLSARGNPEINSAMAILKAMGMRLAVEPIDAAHA
jgi:probable addiction module antidote protein